jgi:predicted secreted protein
MVVDQFTLQIQYVTCVIAVTSYGKAGTNTWNHPFVNSGEEEIENIFANNWQYSRI